MDSENVQVIKSINATDLHLNLFQKYDESNHSMRRSKNWLDQYLQSSKAVLQTHSQLICSTAVQGGSR